MQMSTEYGFAFLCTPKCASTSIESALSGICNINFSGHPSVKHIGAQFFASNILPMHRKLFPSKKIESFCLIRDPHEWIESWYRYRSRDDLKNPKHPNHKNFTGNISYDEFIDAYISKGARPSFANLGTQYNFMKLDTGEIGVDYIFSMDRVDLVIEFIKKITNKDIKIPLTNISPKINTELGAALKEQLNEYLKIDIALYNLVKSEGKFNKTLHQDIFLDMRKNII